ncbi:TetR/AcrR family transcriptional regulator [Sciscionella sediminilitoris]|uniref:TetR/AcrR family transcriptional regulator n=1 Tax=Sciscionella sediminilitoris TaxID=1445613 RepID=UPI0004DFB446|nr:TetR/AcrR family transcriptional regulator [Sciscionella sp. SE31]
MSEVHERRKRRTRQSIQEHAMRLFLEQGFETTTVNQVAEAAEVSAMTVYRHFPTKEHLVLSDDYDPDILELVRAREPGEPLVTRIGRALADGLSRLSEPELDLLLRRIRLMLSAPALRARLLENQHATQAAVVEALRGERTDPEWEFRLRICADACFTATTAALIRWAETDDAHRPGELVHRAIDYLAEETG